MSYLHPNPANQTQSGGTQVVILSGSSSTVGIVGSVGGTTLADVNSNVNVDNLSVGTDALATQALIYGYNLANDQWTRIYSVPMRSGISSTVMPVSGFALLTTSRIAGPQGDVADVWAGDDDDMFEKDPLLQTAGRMYGLANENGASGRTWVRIGATASGQGISGIAHKLAVAFSGDPVSISGQPVSVSISGIAINVSGNVVNVSGQAASVSGNMVSVSGQPANISGNVVYLTSGKNEIQITQGGNIAQVAANTSGDNVSTSDDVLATRAQGFSYYDASGVWTRNRSIDVDEQNYSGFVPVVNIGFQGRVANIDEADNVDTETVNENRLETQTNIHAYNEATSGFARLRAVAVSGDAVSGSFALLVTTPQLSGKRFPAFAIRDDTGIANILSTITDSLIGTTPLSTAAFNIGFDQVTDEWKRLRVTASGQGMSGIVHRLAVAISGDSVSVSGNMVSVSGQPANVSGNVVRIGEG